MVLDDPGAPARASYEDRWTRGGAGSLAGLRLSSLRAYPPGGRGSGL
jgi:hypothetical protein